MQAKPRATPCNEHSGCSPAQVAVLPGLFSIGCRGGVVLVTIIITRRTVMEKAPMAAMAATEATGATGATAMAATVIVVIARMVRARTGRKHSHRIGLVPFHRQLFGR